VKTFKEILDELQAEIETLTKARAVTVCTYEDLLIKVSENKNAYMHVFIVYDLKAITLKEWTQDIPLTLIICDKLRANDENKIYIHSNSLSLSIEVVKLLRTWTYANNYDGINDVTTDVWTEDEADSLLAGTKLEINLIANIGGYCEIITE
jgi:hypothetical protein